MDHPYRDLPDRAFWKRAVSTGWDSTSVPQGGPYLRQGERVASAGSCFAANIVPFIERAGFEYVRTEALPACFASGDENFSYAKFSARYGNIYTVRQALQLVRRAQERFTPAEDRWVLAHDLIADPFRPGLKYAAMSHAEFDALTARHLASVMRALRMADVFVFTLGLTEAWVSSLDGAVFPACPGTIVGTFDAHRHEFHNFTAADVSQDLDELIAELRDINPRLRIILSVSPVPLVATATAEHVLSATTYSKAVLRVAAGEAVARHTDVSYFPAYEIVTGPQAPHDFFEADRRQPSDAAISAVMQAFLARCDGAREPACVTAAGPAARRPGEADKLRQLSHLIAQAECEEAAAGL